MRRSALAGAVALAAQRRPELRGAVYGDGPEREAVREAIERHGVGDRVVAPGFVAAEELHEALRTALCLVLPSSREGYGLVVVEAASLGVPAIVVAAPDNAAVEFIEEGVNGFVVADASAESLAGAIVAVAEGGARLRESTADWFAAHAQELSLDTSLKTVLAGYGEPSAVA